MQCNGTEVKCNDCHADVSETDRFCDVCKMHLCATCKNTRDAALASAIFILRNGCSFCTQVPEEFCEGCREVAKIWPNEVTICACDKRCKCCWRGMEQCAYAEVYSPVYRCVYCYNCAKGKGICICCGFVEVDFPSEKNERHECCFNSE